METFSFTLPPKYTKKILNSFKVRTVSETLPQSLAQQHSMSTCSTHELRCDNSHPSLHVTTPGLLHATHQISR